uniref:Uncharacterized protein n=1 Tax=Rhizophora mucronata TaxID=61149 RepID=A0A2P2QQ37_RHIMU
MFMERRRDKQKEGFLFFPPLSSLLRHGRGTAISPSKVQMAKNSNLPLKDLGISIINRGFSWTVSTKAQAC